MNLPSFLIASASSAVTLQPNFVPQYAPCIIPIGPKPCKIMLLGEAPGEQEERQGLPFVGASGNELRRMCQEARIDFDQTFRTNVFHTRPPSNKLTHFFLSREQMKSLPSPKPGPSSSSVIATSIPPLRIDAKLYHLRESLAPELARLTKEIEECQPNVIIALGNTALWSLTGKQNISSLRGTSLLSSTLSVSRKLLPTYHPAAVLRQWDLRPIVIADLMKAKVQAEFPEIRRPRREILVNPTLADLEHFLSSLDQDSIKALATDIETRNGQITEIGFAPSASFALVVPFIKGYNSHYWPTPTEEAQALRLVRAILAHPVPKIFQNGLYDLQYIWKCWGARVASCIYDTMLHHHALYPELQKGLGFLGSIYTEEPAWKQMRNKKDTMEKADDE